MIVTLSDGRRLETSVLNCSGYVAERIELQPRDCDVMLRYLERDHGHLLIPVLAQLKTRFASERAGYRRKPLDLYPHQRVAVAIMRSIRDRVAVRQFKTYATAPRDGFWRFFLHWSLFWFVIGLTVFS